MPVSTRNYSIYLISCESSSADLKLLNFKSPEDISHIQVSFSELQVSEEDWFHSWSIKIATETQNNLSIHVGQFFSIIVFFKKKLWIDHRNLNSKFPKIYLQISTLFLSNVLNRHPPRGPKIYPHQNQILSCHQWHYPLALLQSTLPRAHPPTFPPLSRTVIRRCLK